jgi:pyruvate/2-oxoglutarate dehydrogenase complex dihydrolipoamide dehydrogenase (E3) component
MLPAGRVLPEDHYDKILIENVHPTAWTNPGPASRYNLVVVGAGTAGLVTAAGAAGLGAKVALVERHLMGGDCLNYGCVPSKCMIRSSRILAEARDGHLLGIRVPPGAEADFPAVMERMRRLRAKISDHDSARRFRELGVDVFLGEGRFAGPDRVEVDGKVLCFKRAVIATGARPVDPPVAGLTEAGYLTNETVFSLTELPRRLLVLGAGPIGCELAQAFRRLGAEVTLVGRAPQLLPREDGDAAAVLAKAFARDGIQVQLNTEVQMVRGSPGGGKEIHLVTGGRADVITVDEILAGAGRAPNVGGLGLEAAGVAYDGRSGVKVNDFLRTTNPAIYAAGDVCLTHKFTHTADATARIVIQNALFKGRTRLSRLTIPWCTYTDPEVAHVGMYEHQARAQGMEVETFFRPLEDVDRAVADGEEEGFVKVHVRKGTDRIVGATIVARHAGEMISEVTLAMVGKVGLKTLATVIHPYPTQAEAIKQVGDAYNRTRLTPFIKGLFRRWLEWTR